MGVIRVIIEKQVADRKEGKVWAKNFLSSVNLLDKVRNFFVGDGQNVLVVYDDSAELTKEFLLEPDKET